MTETTSEKQELLNKVRNEKIISNYQQAQSIDNYFKMVEKCKKEVAKKHPEIPEKDLDLYI